MGPINWAARLRTGGPFFIPLRTRSGRGPSNEDSMVEGPAVIAVEAPPPSFGRSPSPSELGEDIGRAMLYLIIKAALSGIIVAAVSEIARRYPGWGGLVASLPLTSLLAMLWLYRDTGDSARVAELSMGAFWFILPSLP